MTVLKANRTYNVSSTKSYGEFKPYIHSNIDTAIGVPHAHSCTHLKLSFRVVFPELYPEGSNPMFACEASGSYIQLRYPDYSLVYEKGTTYSFTARFVKGVGWDTDFPSQFYYIYRLYEASKNCAPYDSYGYASTGVVTLDIDYSLDGDSDAIRDCEPSARSARVSLLYRKGDSQIRAMTKDVGFSKNQDTSVVFDIRNDFEHEPYKGLDIVGVKVSPDKSRTPAGYNWRVEVGRTRPMLPYSYIDVFNMLFFGSEHLLEYDSYPRGLYKSVQYTKLGFNSDGYGKPSNPSLVYTVEVIFSKISPADDECFPPEEGETPLTMGGDDFIAWVTDDKIPEEEKEERIGIFFPPESEPFLPPDFVLVEPDAGGGMTIVEPKPPVVDDIEPVLPPAHEPNEDLECCRDIILSLNRLTASLDSLNSVVSGGFGGLIESLQAMHVDLVNSIGVEQKRDSYDMTFVESLNYIASLLKSGDMSITDVLKTLDTFLMIDTNNKSIDVEVSNLKNINLEV